MNNQYMEVDSFISFLTTWLRLHNFVMLSETMAIKIELRFYEYCFYTEIFVFPRSVNLCTYNASLIASIHLAFMSSVLAKNENAFEPSFLAIINELFHCKKELQI